MRWGGYTPVSFSDYPGEVAAVLFTRGCNFDCPYCHNRGLLGESCERGPSDNEFLAFLEKRRGFLTAVVVSGGEPTIQPGLVPFLVRLRRETDLKIKLDTNGSRPDVLESILARRLVDTVAMDVKLPPASYARTGWTANTSLGSSLALLAKSGVDYELRTTAVSPVHTAGDLVEIGLALPREARWVVQPFVPRPGTASGLSPFEDAELHEARRLLGQKGIGFALR